MINLQLDLQSHKNSVFMRGVPVPATTTERSTFCRNTRCRPFIFASAMRFDFVFTALKKVDNVDKYFKFVCLGREKRSP